MDPFWLVLMVAFAAFVTGVALTSMWAQDAYARGWRDGADRASRPWQAHR